MFSSKRMVSSLLLGLVAALAFAIPAQATGNDIKADCAINASVKTQDKLSPELGVLLLGGGGKFTLTSLAIDCVGTEKGQPVVLELDVTATGHYENIVCGTGKAYGGSIVVTDVVGSTKADPEGFYNGIMGDEKFAVEFDEFEGQFFWHDTAKELPNTKVDLTDPSKGEVTSKDWELAGEVNLLPPTMNDKAGLPNTEAGECMKAFHVVGDIIIDE